MKLFSTFAPCLLDVIFLMLFWIFVFFIPLTDFFIKKQVCNFITIGMELNTVIPFLKIVMVKNYGVALGMFQKKTLITIILTAIVLIFMIFMVVFKKINNRILVLAFSLVIGGGIGNLIDRLSYGYVIDYLKLTFFPPVCNLSDYFISIGAVMIIIYFIFIDKKQIN